MHKLGFRAVRAAVVRSGLVATAVAGLAGILLVHVPAQAGQPPAQGQVAQAQVDSGEVDQSDVGQEDVADGAPDERDPAVRAALSPADLAAVQERLADGVLRWGGDAEGGAPFQMRDLNDLTKVVGFEVELADGLAAALAVRLGRPLTAEFVQYEWVSLSQGLSKGDFDLILSGYEVTPDRAEVLRYTRPYYIFKQQLVARHDEQAIASLADCEGKPVGTLSGSAADELLQERGLDVHGYDGQVEPFLDLELGRLDAVLLDVPIVTYYADPNPKLKRIGPPLAPGMYAMAVRLEDGPLATALNVALSDLIVSGNLKKIYRRWHLWNEDQIGLVERAALQFDPAEPPAGDEVDRQVVASSATRWTFSRYAPVLVQAAGMTVFLTVASMTVAMLWGLAVALARLYGPSPLRWLALGYVEFFRGIPLLLVLYFLYYGLAGMGMGMPALVAAVIGFGLNYAAYEAEIYRSAILSVPSRQWEAGRALGMGEVLIFRQVIFPQAIRTALGPMTNDFVALFKDTSLVSVIAVHELTKEYLILSRSSLKFVELGLLTAGLYLAMSIPLGYLSRTLEARWGTVR